MNYSSRIFLYGPFAILLLIAAVVGVNWWFAFGALSRHLVAMHGGDPAMPGVTVDFRTMSIGGFPFNVDAVFEDFRVGVATPRGPIVWRAEHFALHGLTYGRDETIYEAAGRQSVEWGKGHRLDFEAGSLHASAIRDAGGLARFDLDIVAFVSSSLTASRLQFHTRHTGQGIDLFASADDVHLSPALRGAFGDRIKMAAWQGSVSAPRAFDGLRAGRADLPGALEAWRTASDTLGAEPFEIDWGTIDMMGHGALGIDAAKRPAGLIDFKIAGISAWLARDVHGPFADALRARAAGAGSNEAGKLGVVFGARDGIVYLGDRPVGMVEPLY